MVNALTRQTGARLGPLLLETLVKHYFDRLLKDNVIKTGGTKLRKDELLYDEAFIIVKTFLEAASKHPVEELQTFSNTRTPSPPWVRVVRLVVPMSCCDEAADIVVEALGGEETTKRLVGGTKWWQVRGVKGVDAEWITTKKDWEDSEKKYKARQKDREPKERSASNSPVMNDEEGASYDPSMDEMRCVFYCHGGGYFFGSLDQERYAIQRFARKINGRAFAINYRLAPQYPFPCALQDAIAAYLFLIRPPEGAAHRPVKPEHIVIAGDSAGGGLSIALLQVIRDCGLPLPAGAVLISPWCDMTHSFPSIHTNTATDVIPPYGLSFYKPSPLWPPPPDDMTVTVREGLRSRIRQVVTLTADAKPGTDLPPHSHSPSRSRSGSRSQGRPVTPLDGGNDLRLPQTGQTLHLGSTASLPTVFAGVRDQTVHCVTEKGETLSIAEQIHLYAPNYLLAHPLISPVVSYLGGLPPLFIVAGDGEVLRDEIIYLAHKAAHPEQYSISQQAKDIYPVLNGIEERFPHPTAVHLQVYDDAAHVLPILFSFTTPAKYCFRAMALFIRQVTGMLSPSPSPSQPENIDIPITFSPLDSPNPDLPRGENGMSSSNSSPQPDTERLAALGVGTQFGSRSSPSSRDPSPFGRRRSLFRRDKKKAEVVEQTVASSPTTTTTTTTTTSRLSFKTFFRSSVIVESPASEQVPNVNGTSATSSAMSSNSASPTPTPASGNTPRESSIDVGGPRFRGSGMHHEAGVRKAGEAQVYQHGIKGMIRERVSTHGIVRPLEPESQLAPFSLQPERIGQVSELAMRRYFDAKAKFDKKFSGTYKTIEKHRQKHIEKAQKDAMRNMAQLQNYIQQDERREREGEGNEGGKEGGGHAETVKGVKEGLVVSGSWSWAWALDLDEKPPPSSIVARRDTHEAVELARIADQAVLAEENILSGNSLWSLMVNFLTVTPDKDKEKRKPGRERGSKIKEEEKMVVHKDVNVPPDVDARESNRERVRSRFAQLFTDSKKQRTQVPPQAVADTSAPVSQQSSQSTSITSSSVSTS